MNRKSDITIGGGEPSLSNMILFILERQKITQKRLSKISGINETDISLIKRGFVPNDQGESKSIQILYNMTLNGVCFNNEHEQHEKI